MSTLLDGAIRRTRNGAGRLLGWPGAIDGVAAVEFALVLPIMLMMLLGMTEVTLAVINDRKMTLLSRSLADLTSRSATADSSGNTIPSTIDSTGIANVFSASTVIMQPYSSNGMRMVLSSMKATWSQTSNSYKARVAWSCASGTDAIAKDITSDYTVPAGFQNSSHTDVYYILSETVLPYRPVFGATITGTLNLTDATPWPVRNGDRVQIKGNSCPASCTCVEPLYAP